jgi:glycosyltransferase involved in cell wall biosynthesis
MPARNAARWIEESIASVMALRAPEAALELVVVDNGSTDDTAARVERQLREAPIAHRLLRQPPRGPSAARNAGWRAARGEWLLFLDADDLADPQLVADLLAVGAHADIAYGAWARYRLAADRWRADDVQVAALGDAVALELLEDRNFVPTGSYLIRRAMLESIGGFDEDFFPVEDLNLLIRAALHGARFVRAPGAQPRLLYRQHAPDRHSRQDYADLMDSAVRNAALVEAHLRERNGLDARARASIARVYFQAAHFHAGHDWPRFGELTARIRNLGVPLVPPAPAGVAVLARVVGYERAERIASAYRVAKGWLRR